jgi:hypothetical protein
MAMNDFYEISHAQLRGYILKVVNNVTDGWLTSYHLAHGVLRLAGIDRSPWPKAIERVRRQAIKLAGLGQIAIARADEWITTRCGRPSRVRRRHSPQFTSLAAYREQGKWEREADEKRQKLRDTIASLEARASGLGIAVHHTGWDNQSMAISFEELDRVLKALEAKGMSFVKLAKLRKSDRGRKVS